MDPKDIRTLKILEKVDDDKSPSQRDLAGELNISLGLVNSFVKRLVKKGFVKITTIPKRRIKYIITPRGAAEKSRLTYLYVQQSYHFYREARQKLRNLYAELENQGIANLVFYGAGDLAEIAYISLQQTSLQLVAIVDDEKIDIRFMKIPVTDPAHLDTISYDRIVVTAVNSRGAILQKLAQRGISSDFVVQIN
ncbi:Transcriptional regulator, MarR family [Olavius algarvensis Delta 1 endosymbiont]|nr:Transcriptional regulator, MarR family [Olavius algarvensis Delta 1 endosymbiont]